MNSLALYPFCKSNILWDLDKNAPDGFNLYNGIIADSWSYAPGPTINSLSLLTVGANLGTLDLHQLAPLFLLISKVSFN